jgi:hypothetical protein
VPAVFVTDALPVGSAEVRPEPDMFTEETFAAVQLTVEVRGVVPSDGVALMLAAGDETAVAAKLEITGGGGAETMMMALEEAAAGHAMASGALVVATPALLVTRRRYSPGSVIPALVCPVTSRSPEGVSRIIVAAWLAVQVSVVCCRGCAVTVQGCVPGALVTVALPLASVAVRPGPATVTAEAFAVLQVTVEVNGAIPVDGVAVMLAVGAGIAAAAKASIVAGRAVMVMVTVATFESAWPSLTLNVKKSAPA